MLAKRLPTTLPPLNLPDSLEATCAYSAVGTTTPDQPLHLTWLFFDPHNTTS